MADERLKVETELNQTGNAAQSLEKTVGLLDRAIEAERKLASMAGQAEAAMTKLGGAAGGLSRADEAINRDRSRSSLVGGAFGAALSRPPASVATERAYEAFRRDQTMVRAATATGLQSPAHHEVAPPARRSAALDLTPGPEPLPETRRGASLGQSAPAAAVVPRQPAPSNTSDRAATQLVATLLANTRATELNTSALLKWLGGDGAKPGAPRGLLPTGSPTTRLSSEQKEQRDWSLYSRRERQEIETRDKYQNEVRLHGRAGADRRIEQRQQAQAKDRASAAFPRASAIFGEGATAQMAGALAKFAGPIGIAVAGLQTLSQGLKLATTGVNIFSNSSLTNAQKMERFSESLPVVGGFLKSIREFGESVSGTTEKMRKLGIEREVADLQRGRHQEADQLGRALGAETRAVESRATAMSGPAAAQFDAYRVVGKDQVGGEVRHREEEMRREASDSLVRARREAAALKLEHGGQQGVVDKRAAAVVAQRERLGQANKEVERLRQIEDDKAKKEGRPSVGKRLLGFALNPLGGAVQAGVDAARGGGGREKAGMQRALQEADAASKDLALAEKNHQAEIERLKKSGVEARKAEAMVQERIIGQSKAELEILKMKEQRMVSAQQRLGGMHRGERVMALQAVKQIKQHGIENASPEMIQWAQRGAPEMVKKLQERVGGKELEKWQKELEGVKGHADKGEEAIQDDFQEFKGENLKEIRQKIEVQQQNIRVDVQLNEEKLAAAIASQLGPLNDLIVKIAAEAEKRARGDVERNQQMRNNAG